MTEVVVDLTRRFERLKARPGMPLSAREREVLYQLSHGHNYEGIAEVLDISIDTVKSHLRRAFVKLEARGGPHAVGLAYRLGIFGGGGDAA